MNPFLDILKADVLSPDQATRLFVPEASPIWEDVQRPINHILIGPRGAGKTMALKQLDHKSHWRTAGAPFVGLYLQISRICTIFSSLFDHSRSAGDNALTATFMRIFADYVWLEVVREVLDFLRLREDIVSPASATTAIQEAFGFDVRSIADAEAHRGELAEGMEQTIQEWSTNPDAISWTMSFNPSQSLDRCANALRSAVSRLARDRPCVYLLLDESSPIPIECQAVLNGLLHRGHSYCVKLAVRPFEWATFRTAAGRTIELDTDVWPLQVRYPSDDNYASQMAKVLVRVLRTHDANHQSPTPAVDKIFPRDDSFRYSGFSSLARASSGNPQNMLQICSYMFGAVTFRPDTGFAPELQDRVIRAWSKDYEDRNPYTDSRSFCRALLRRIAKGTSPAIGFRVRDEQEDLFSGDYVRPALGRLIQSGFAGGFLRALDPERARSLVEVPARFTISPGLLPVVGLQLNVPVEPLTEIDGEFVRDGVRGGPRRPPVPEPRREMKAFLSTSFSRAVGQQRSDIKEYLRRVGVKCDDVEDRLEAQFLFSAIVRKIRESDFVVLDATVLRPYTMLEIGICAGVPRRPKDVVCVINEDSDQAVRDLPPFVQVLPILTFSYDSGRLVELAAKILSRAEGLLAQKSEFGQVAITRASLRRPRRQKSVYVSLPPSSVSRRALLEIRKDLEAVGWNVFSDEDGESYCANAFQVSVYCAHLTRVGVVDTSGSGEGDLLQCFRLGLFVGKGSPWRVLHTRHPTAGEKGSEPFASVPNLHVNAWNTIEELKQLIVEFLGVQGPGLGR